MALNGVSLPARIQVRHLTIFAVSRRCPPLTYGRLANMTPVQGFIPLSSTGMVPSGRSSRVRTLPRVKAPLNGVDALTANNIWAVGFTTDMNGFSQTLAEHWNGTT